MRDREHREFFARFLLAVLVRTVGGHVGDLAREAARARLSAGIGIDLRVDDEDPDRLVGRQ